MKNWKYFLVKEAERKNVRRCTIFQQHGDVSSHQDIFFFQQGNAAKEIHTILKGTLWEHAPSYATVKNWVAQFNVVIFEPVLRLVLDDTEQ